MRKYFTNKYQSQLGMSLVELSISIAIIALLISTVAMGVNMVHSAKLRKVVAELSRLYSGMEEFEENYGYLPGDIPTAFDFWGGDCGADTSGAADSCNGNGNGFIEYSESTTGAPQEDLLAFEHLTLSDLISGSFTGDHANVGARYEFGTNAPSSSAFPDAGFMISSEFFARGNDIYNTRGHVIRIGSLVDESGSKQQYPTGGFISAKDAYSIDKKADDGKASSGRVYGVRETTALGSSGCVDATWNAPSADYELDNSDETCSIIYWYKKF